MSDEWLNRNVKIVKLMIPDREVAGTLGMVEEPKVGDVAKVIYEYPPPETKVTVEMADATGSGTLWFADFSREELELLPEGD